MLRLPEFHYLQPVTLKQALAWKSDAGPDATYVAGGTDLYPNMKRRHQQPRVVISLAGIRALKQRPAARRNGGTADGGFTLGAGLTLTEVVENPRLRRHYPVVPQAADLISTPPLRNMGTLGGNLCLDTRCNYYNQSYEWRKAIDFCMKKDGAICWVAPSSPRCWAVQSSDLAPVMVALGARLRLIGPSGERLVSAAEFYRDDGIAHLTRQPHEIVAEVILPAANGWDATYHKLRRRGAFDFPVLGVAAWVRWDGAAVADARIVLGGVASYPQAVAEAARAIRGTRLEEDAVRAAAEAAFKPAKPMDNTDFGLSWRKEMTRVYVRRALEELRDRRR
jgi:4-hydroxybenzoyl-CoA reductase subunit beta